MGREGLHSGFRRSIGALVTSISLKSNSAADSCCLAERRPTALEKNDDEQATDREFRLLCLPHWRQQPKLEPPTMVPGISSFSHSAEAANRLTLLRST
jgi:hypothetical protein